MKSKIALFLFFLTIAACGDDKPFDKEGNINFATNHKDRQMGEFLKYNPADRLHEEARHFHVSGKPEDNLRMIENLYGLLKDESIKQLSLGCDDAAVCSSILYLSLQRALENKLYRGDLLLILPGYLATPYPAADKIGVSIVLYE